MNVDEAELPRVSAELHVTSVEPTEKALPEEGMQVTGRTPSTRSFAAGGVQLTTVVAPVASVWMLVGCPMVGAVVSPTVTVKLPSRTLPAASVAEHSTVVVAIGKAQPAEGVQVTAGVGR